MNTFIAENIYALFEGRQVEVCHMLRFYDKYGKQIKSHKIIDSNYFSRMELPSIKEKSEYISFTHESYKIKNRNLTFRNESNIHSQHRGYSVYTKINGSLGSVVHGNFGGIYPPNLFLSAAKQRNKLYCYTPMYVFNKFNHYHLVFNNPTKINLKVDLKENYNRDSTIISSKSIPPFGTDYFDIINYEGTISFYSKLPICRCLIFKNPSLEENDFDVFHS
ncbi:MULTISPECIES: hypothetical protein [Prochlorococcus]|uniref:hypothetical protein n=1 Tax=Prochlorococcus TaxID=1218 RepID=UPI00187BFFC5|nr:MULTISPECIES: hypothetical protein [Prochlorococcus]